MVTVKNRKLFFFLPLAIIALPAIILYWQRNNILEPFVQKKIVKFEQGKPIRISYDRIFLSGINKLELDGLTIYTTNNDTLSRTEEIDAKLNLWKLLFKETELKDLQVKGFSLSLKNGSEKRIYDFLFRKKGNKQNEDASDAHSSGYTRKAAQAIELFFRFAPENILITGMNISIQHTGFWLNLHIPELKIADHTFSSEVQVNEQGEKQSFMLDGTFWREEKKLACKIYPKETAFAEMPYLQHKFNTRVVFDTLQFQFSSLKNEKELLRLGGVASSDNLTIQNERLSTEEVLFQKSKIDYVVNIYPDYVELDSSTVVQFYKLDFHPYMRLKMKPEVDLTVSVRKTDFPADNLFSSLPKGLFRNLEGIKTSGNLSYNFYFSVNMAEVDSLQFHSSMSKENFRIEQFGKTDFTKIRGPFLYSAYEKGELAKTFEVGEDFPDFRQLEAISPYLKAAVLFAEDGSFFGHKGFNEEALRSSLAKDIKEKRFARGGSTISMQLVKNLYLSRDKTITRKLEEALIVWLIENNRLVSKNRMFEIYLNIIEWGPNVYGANDAARFYFSKEAADLTPEEAIFMASIVSHPKKFMWSFDQNRALKPRFSGFYKTLGKRMLSHENITEEQFENLTPDVRITGGASVYLAKVDSVEVEKEDDDWED
ncbi:MAG: transglycosylase domain-containing protein [Prevotellaceae bacterium]|jgi:hypothetical protein|nr:transglycosylase domain-containing protein [Prevotellaceae bacterium]